MSTGPDIFRCPGCQASLDTSGPDWRCQGCHEIFPLCDGIPWLYRDVASSRAQWASKLQLLRATQGSRIKEMQTSLTGNGLLPATRARLERLVRALESQLDQLLELLGVFELDSVSLEVSLPRDRIPSQQHFGSYFETIFRDWAWGESEVEAATEITASLLGDDRAGQRLLVLGGGAGRLSCELACSAPWGQVVQLDINPLLTRIGALLAAGRPFKLTEIPNLPGRLGSVAIEHELTGIEPGAPLYFALGDVFAPPFESESFDVLVTPWLIDILPEDFRLVARRLNRLLAEGGSWISFGPLSFESHPSAARYTREEVFEALAEAGFDVESHEQRVVPYLHSPNGSSRRHEQILIFQARKRDTAASVPDFSFYPDWMSDSSLPVPRSEAWQRMQHERIFDLEILSLIDGRASIQDMVKSLARKYSLAPERCAAAVGRFFSSIFEKNRKS